MSRRARELTAASAASAFAALGDDIRLSLLSRLCDGQPRSILQLTQGTKLSRQGHEASDDTRTRKYRGKTTCRPGKSIFGAAKALNEAKDFLARASQQWADAMARLKQLVGG